MRAVRISRTTATEGCRLRRLGDAAHPQRQVPSPGLDADLFRIWDHERSPPSESSPARRRLSPASRAGTGRPTSPSATLGEGRAASSLRIVGTVSVLRGVGTAPSRSRTPTRAEPNSVAGDFDGDLYDDVVVSAGR
jgi:hypothetical protein